MLVPALTNPSNFCWIVCSVVSPATAPPWAASTCISVSALLTAVTRACTELLMLVWSDATEMVTLVAGALTVNDTPVMALLKVFVELDTV